MAEVGSESSSELPLEVEGPKGYLGDGEREKAPAGRTAKAARLGNRTVAWVLVSKVGCRSR